MPRRPSGRRTRACDAAPRAFPPRTPARWRWANPRTPAWRRSSQPHRQSRARCPPRAWSYPRPSGRGRTPRRGAARADPTRPAASVIAPGPSEEANRREAPSDGEPGGRFILAGDDSQAFPSVRESSTFSHLAVCERRSHTFGDARARTHRRDTFREHGANRRGRRYRRRPAVPCVVGVVVGDEPRRGRRGAC